MRRPALLVALILLAAVPAATAAGPAPGAHAARGCSVGSGRHLGTTYVYRLRVSGTSCRQGRRVVKGYHNCRHHNGGADGRCGRTFGYRCGEHRFNKGRFSYDARAGCSKRGKRVSFTYTQNL
jgi:hypothetical protein